MHEWEDYYKILQVHYLAEPEVIESAYRRLSKKYHPDVNKMENANEVMALINKAYEVLNDPNLRRQYFLRWVEKNSGLSDVAKEKLVSHKFDCDPTNGILIKYFKLLRNREFSMAYDLLSETDKSNVSKKQFEKWQEKVSEVFEIRKVECVVKNIYVDANIEDFFYNMIVEFEVKVVEMNNLMGRLEEDSFSKIIVLENNNWRLLLGYKCIDALIKRFDELANLKKIRFYEKRKIQKFRNIDGVSGLLNKRGFTEKAENEQMRYKRYGNVFSVVLCEIYAGGQWSGKRYSIIKQVGEIINTCLRSLDISCRWKGRKFILLLPETNALSAQKVAIKLHDKIKEFYENWNEEVICMNFIIIQQNANTLDLTIKKAESAMKDLSKEGSNILIIQ